MPQQDRDEDVNPFLRCCNRLALIPCSAFSLFLLLVVSVVVCLVSVLIGTQRAQHEFKLHHDKLQLVLPVWLGMTVGTLAVGAFYLLVSTFSAQKLPLVSNGEGESRGVIVALKVLNVMVVSLMILLQCFWLLAITFFGAIILFLKHVDLVSISGPNGNGGCIKLSNYGLPVERGPICFEELQSFRQKLLENDLHLCYGLAFLSAAAIVPSLTMLIISMWTNLVCLGGLCSREDKDHSRDQPSNSLSRKKRSDPVTPGGGNLYLETVT